MASRMKTVSFTVRASEKQSFRWKRAADSEGAASVGGWIAEALDRYLDDLQRAGKPLPLAWGRGRFKARMEDGTEPELRGWVARPFGLFHGTPEGPISHGSTHYYTLVYLPTSRLLATFRTAKHCKVLASELARLWVHWGGREPAEDPAPLLQRFQREDV